MTDMPSASRSAYNFELSGGTLCLDFANTVDNRPDASRRLDHFTGYSALLAFFEQSGALNAKQASDLGERAGRAPRSAGKVFQAAIALRETIYRVFSAVAAERAPVERDMEMLNAFLSEAMAHRRVVLKRPGFAWNWAWSEDEALGRILWPPAVSAAELLAADRLESVRECAAETCGWLFLDHSRNQSRRWCDMKVCGNRAKARRHYQRRRAPRVARTLPLSS